MILAATGHRPDKLGGYSGLATSVLRAVAERAVRHTEPTHLYVGMAQGWDTAVAEAAVRMGVPWTATMPFRAFGYRWSSVDRAKLSRLLKRATEVVYVSEEPGFAPAALDRRNEYMVDRADAVLACWNGDRSGGTWNALEYARKAGKPVAFDAYPWVEEGFKMLANPKIAE